MHGAALFMRRHQGGKPLSSVEDGRKMDDGSSSQECRNGDGDGVTGMVERLTGGI